MPNKLILAGAASLLGTLAMTGTAFAGHCAAGQNCDMGVTVYNDYAPRHDNMTVHNMPPGHHYRSINFQGAPNVSITRVHGMAPSAALSDAPSAFTDGCHPESTEYCRTDMGTPVQVQMAPAPMAPAPVVQAPVYRAPAPVVAAPVQQPLRTWVGGGYDPSKFAPRQYGENTFTPGIAYLPTSRVVRDPAAAQAVLNSGRTQPQSTVLGGQAPHMGMVTSQSMNYGGSVTLPGTYRAAAAPMAYGGSVTLPGTHQAMGSYSATPAAVLTAPAMAYDGNGPRTILRETPFPAPAQAPMAAGNNTYVSNIGADGTYWEKTSGLTTFGNTVATQVICKRRVEQKVVNPVVGVPVPVPTRVVNPVVRVPVAVPTPVEVPAQPYCDAPAPQHMAHGRHAPVAQHGNVGRYGQSMMGRWTR